MRRGLDRSVQPQEIRHHPQKLFFKFLWMASCFFEEVTSDPVFYSVLGERGLMSHTRLICFYELFQTLQFCRGKEMLCSSRKLAV